MKKLFKNSVLMLAALLLGFSSCNKEDIPILDISEYKTLSLRISSDVATRGISESVPDGTPVTFNTGTLFLVNSDGVIVQHFNIVPRGQATIGSNISRADFDSSVTIDNIPGQVVSVVVVGNTGNNNTAGSISAIGERVLDIVTQYDVTNVNLFGRAMFQPTGFVHPITGNNVYEANILLSPTVARFEIADITGAGQIESFTIEGIFIDHYYRQAQIAGSILTTADNFVSNGQDPNLFVHGSSAYPATLTPALFDWGAWSGSRSTSLTVTPDNTGNVWAYQLFAQVDANEDATTVPSIIIRMRDVTLRDGTQIQGSRFLTIRGIYTQNGVLEGIRSGIVYRFPAGKIVFTERELSPRPNENVIDARVTVSLANWNEEVLNVPRPYNPSFWVDLQGNRHYFNAQNTPIGSWTFTSDSFSFGYGHAFINGRRVTRNCVVEVVFGDSYLGVTSPPGLNRMSNLKRVDLTPLTSVTTIGYGFLSQAWSLTEVDLTPLSNVTTIGSNFLSWSGLTHIDLSMMTNVTTIGGSFMLARSGGNNYGVLQSIDISGFTNVTTIGNGFLEGQHHLERIDLSALSNVTTIGWGFLGWNKSLTEIDLAPLSNLQSVTSNFMAGAIGLTSVDISPLTSIESIGWGFFRDSNNIKRVFIGQRDWTEVQWQRINSTTDAFGSSPFQWNNVPSRFLYASSSAQAAAFQDIHRWSMSNWTVIIQP